MENEILGKIDDKLSRQIVGYNNDIMMVKVKFKEGGIGPVPIIFIHR